MEAAVVVNTTAKKYLKGAIDNTVRNRLIFKLIEQKNRISLNHDGFDQTWDIEFKQTPIVSYGDGGVLSFSRHDNFRQLTLDWRGYKGTDAMTEKEYLMNSGSAAIVRRYDKIIPMLTRSLTDTFNGEIYVDGNLAANSNRLHGLESFLGNDGNTVAADKIANPSDTYAGRSTALASEGGSSTANLTVPPNATLSNDWPEGQADAHYDFNSPLLVNYSSTNWGTSQSTAWEDNCVRALRYAINFTTHKGGEEATPDCFLLATNLFTGFQNRWETAQRVNVPHKRAQDLGFDGVLNFDGVMIKKEYDVPTGVGYGLNIDQMELMSLDKVLFHVHGPTFDPRTCEYLMQVGYYGNLRFNPKHFSRLDAYA